MSGRTVFIQDNNIGVEIVATIDRIDYPSTQSAFPDENAKKAEFAIGYDRSESISEAVHGDGVEFSVKQALTLRTAAIGDRPKLTETKYDYTGGANVEVKPASFLSLYRVTPSVVDQNSKSIPAYSDLLPYSGKFTKTINNTEISIISKRNLNAVSGATFSGKSFDGTYVTVTINKTAHGLRAGDPLFIYGFTDPALNYWGTVYEAAIENQFKYRFLSATNPTVTTGTILYTSEIYGYLKCDAQIVLHEVNGVSNQYLTEFWIKNNVDRGGGNLDQVVSHHDDLYDIHITRNDGVATHGDATTDKAYSYGNFRLKPGLNLRINNPEYFLISSGIVDMDH